MGSVSYEAKEYEINDDPVLFVVGTRGPRVPFLNEILVHAARVYRRIRQASVSQSATCENRFSPSPPSPSILVLPANSPSGLEFLADSVRG